MLIKELTTGERLFVWRKRNKWSYTEAANRMKVNRNTYHRAENDDPATLPPPALGKLTQTDIFLIYRKRSGLSVSTIAKKLKCCSWWVRQMENGKVDSSKLKSFWL